MNAVLLTAFLMTALPGSDEGSGGRLGQNSFVAPHASSGPVLLEVVLVSTQERILVEGILTHDSTLLIPAEPVYRLLGLPPPASTWTMVKTLQRAYPTARFSWVPLEQRLYVFDPLEVFPATRQAKAAVIARAQSTVALPIQSGPFAALSFDDSLHGVFDLGYSYRGRLAFAGRVDDRGAGSWGVTLAPSPHLFLAYSDGVNRPANISGRIAVGPLWLSTSYVPAQPVEVAGLVRGGPVQLFASKQFGVVTWQPNSQLTVQAARTWRTNRTAVRVSVGPVYASPFSFPTTSLR